MVVGFEDKYPAEGLVAPGDRVADEALRGESAPSGVAKIQSEPEKRLD